jgi:hypothetical protein
MSVVNSGLRSRYEQQFLPRMKDMPDGAAACKGKHELFQKLIEGRGSLSARREAQEVCDGCPLRDVCPARVKKQTPNKKTPGRSVR